MLGDKNVQLIRENNYAGKIKEIDVKKIALKMGFGAHGVYEQNREKHKLLDVWRLMLDKWFEEFLFKHVDDGLEELLKILEDPDIRLNFIAHSLEKKSEELGSASYLNESETKDKLLGK